MNPLTRVMVYIVILALPIVYVSYVGQYFMGIIGTIVLGCIATFLMITNDVERRHIIELWIVVIGITLFWWESQVWCDMNPYRFCQYLRG